MLRCGRHGGKVCEASKTTTKLQRKSFNLPDKDGAHWCLTKYWSGGGGEAAGAQGGGRVKTTAMNPCPPKSQQPTPNPPTLQLPPCEVIREIDALAHLRPDHRQQYRPAAAAAATAAAATTGGGFPRSCPRGNGEVFENGVHVFRRPRLGKEGLKPAVRFAPPTTMYDRSRAKGVRKRRSV